MNEYLSNYINLLAWLLMAALVLLVGLLILQRLIRGHFNHINKRGNPKPQETQKGGEIYDKERKRWKIYH